MTIITVAFFAQVSMQWCCCMSWNVGECRSPTYFRGGTRFQLLFSYCFPLVLIPTMMVLNQSTNRRPYNNSSTDFVLR